MRIALRVIFVLLLLLCHDVSAKSQKLDTSIRTTNWDSLLATDHSHFVLDSEFSFEGYETPGYLIQGSKTLNERGELEIPGEGGHRTDVMYFDFNNDGIEDAVVTLFSGGSGWFGSYVIFLASSEGPKLAAYGGGPGYDIYHNKDTLILLSWDPAEGTPPSWDGPYMEVHRMIWKDGGVTKLPVFETAIRKCNSCRRVESYYEMLNKGRFKTAYGYLSDQYRALHPFSSWLQSTEATNPIVAWWIFPSWCSDDLITVYLHQYSKKNGEPSDRRFYGVWHMAKNSKRGWLLDVPEIREMR